MSFPGANRGSQVDALTWLQVIVDDWGFDLVEVF